MALDKITVHQFPLLAEYQPGFHPSLWDSLLLPKRLEMERLANVEEYVLQRISNSNYPSSYIFEQVNTAKSFNVRYFDQSPQHQDLRANIEAAATTVRNAKMEELRTKTDEYNRLIQRSSSLSCEYNRTRTRYGWRNTHSNYCEKCRLQGQATALYITVHEWPLSSIKNEAESAVFELEVPRVIIEWRDTTFALLVDTFSPHMSVSSGATSTYYLYSYNGLSSHVRSRGVRLQFSSVAKPFETSHYSYQQVAAATEENICVKNALHYAMYDSNMNQSTGTLLGKCNVRTKCTFQLPNGIYKCLQYALDKTTHTSNETLAWQSTCPKDLNLHEYYVFANLRKLCSPPPLTRV